MIVWACWCWIIGGRGVVKRVFVRQDRARKTREEPSVERLQRAGTQPRYLRYGEKFTPTSA